MKSMYCYCCGRETPYEHLDAKPIWTFTLWLIAMFRGQKAALSYAADCGMDFDMLECCSCYGQGYERSP